MLLLGREFCPGALRGQGTRFGSLFVRACNRPKRFAQSSLRLFAIFLL